MVVNRTRRKFRIDRPCEGYHAGLCYVASRVVSLQQPSGPENDTELGELLPDDAPSPPELAEAAMIGEEVRALLDLLHPRERAVLELRFGLNDETPLTDSEAARRLGLRRREAVRLEELALRRLRATPPISGLAAVA